MQPKKRANSLDVARLAGVSQTTVSFVLNDRSDRQISDEVKKRVWKAVEELGYRPNRLANALLRGKSQTIGIMLPTDSAPFHTEIVNGISDTLSKNDYRVLMATDGADPVHEIEEIRMLLDHSVDGIIACSSWLTIDSIPLWLALARERNVPVCLVDDDRYADQVDTVISDDLSGMRQALDYVVSLGHRKIAHFAGDLGSSSGRTRVEGFRAALQDAGIEEEPWMVSPLGYSIEAYTEEKVLRAAGQATAILCSSDDLAGFTTMVLREHGRHVPNDVSVIGYSNSRWSSWFGLSTIDQDPHRMGAMAAERILSRQTDDTAKPRLSLAPTRLVPRTSCGPVG